MIGRYYPPVISNLHLADGTTIKGENPVVPLSGNTDDPGSMTILENASEWQAAEANPQNGTAFLWNITLKPGLNTASLTSLDQVGNGSAAQTAVTYIPTGTATWRFSVASAGAYDVAARWIGQGSAATAVYRITHADGTAAVTATPAATGNLALGSYRFLPGNVYAVSMDSAEGIGVAVADAVSLTPQEAGFNIFPDQLGTPRVITDANGQEVWRWEMDDPFGPNPAVGSIEMPLRFPGQVFDSETGLHYNYFRDYDPRTGRYFESDPLGLAGGINTYSYVEGNPVSYVDPEGLLLTALHGLRRGMTTDAAVSAGGIGNKAGLAGGVAGVATGAVVGTALACGPAVTAAGALVANNARNVAICAVTGLACIGGAGKGLEAALKPASTIIRRIQETKAIRPIDKLRRNTGSLPD